MKYEIGRVVKVQNRDYLIVSKLEDEGIYYVYLMSVDQPISVLIARENVKSPRLIEIEVLDDASKFQEIYEKFVENASK